MSLFELLIVFGLIIIALSVHEFAHAVMADKLGDPTAKLSGRLTLNPLAHLDPLGTAVLFFGLMNGIGFGWGKPVPIDPYNLRNPKRDSAIISLAGPLSNLLLAVILAVLLQSAHFLPLKTYAQISFLFPIIVFLIQLNVGLSVFNLIPLHPLDGGKILTGFLPQNTALEVENFLNRNSLLILIFLLIPIFQGPLIFKIISPIINFILSLLLPGSGII